MTATSSRRTPDPRPGGAPDATVDEMAAAAGTEAGVVADLALAAAGQVAPHKLLAGDYGDGDVPVRAWLVADRQRVHLESLERYQAEPARPRGAVTLLEPASFIAYVHRLATPASTTVWVHRRDFTSPPGVTAVFNDHAATGPPGWRDHTAVLALRPTAEWARWVARDGHLSSQLAFAEHVEDGIGEIVRPDAATLMEIAQTFHATTAAEFSQATRLTNGQVQVRWHEDTKESAGRTGQLDVPADFVIALAPWPGGPTFEVTARLRYRLARGQLAIGYQLHRVDDVMRSAVDALVAELATDLEGHALVLAGAAPAPLEPVTALPTRHPDSPPYAAGGVIGGSPQH